MKIAITGSGISGLASAWLLHNTHDITLFEKNDYVGGHSNTAVIDYDGQKIPVDTGFIVFNFVNYPNLKAFFEILDVKIEKSDMSFGVKDIETGLEFNGRNFSGLFAQKKNIVNPEFLSMLKEILEFNKLGEEKLRIGEISNDITIDEFVDSLGLSDYFKREYLFPMGASIWSCPPAMIKSYPATTFLRFFYNHGLLTVNDQPQWYTVTGGSKEYVKKVVQKFSDRIKLNCGIVKCIQKNGGVELTDSHGERYLFDQVIFASHADQTYKIIQDKSEAEEAVLSRFQFSKNTVILHRDVSQMPVKKGAWASWVYINETKKNRASLNYWMNNLQNISHEKPLFVTLNPINEIADSAIFKSYHYQHPIFDFAALKAQHDIKSIQGKRNIWFCGAWTKYGFHEDGLKSAMEVAESLGVKIPWQKQTQ